MRSLDFIVFGVGRSGTTALATSLNLHPQLLCGVERFHYNVDPRAINVPEAFEDQTFICDASLLPYNLQLVRDKSASVVLFGNKSPRYFCNLKAWQNLNPEMQKVAIYRSPYEYLASWTTRAKNPADTAWPTDLDGVFGIYELFGMLRALLDHADDALMIPYGAFYFGTDATILDIVSHLGADPDDYPHEEFRKTVFSSGAPAGARPRLTRDVHALLEIANVDALDRILLRDRVFRIGEVRDLVEGWLHAIPAQLGEMAEAWLLARESDNLHKLLLFWTRLFPRLDVLPNAMAVPATFKLYHNMVHTEGYSQWVAAIDLAKKTNTSPLSNILHALGAPFRPAHPTTQYLSKLSRRTLRPARSR